MILHRINFSAEKRLSAGSSAAEKKLVFKENFFFRHGKRMKEKQKIIGEFPDKQKKKEHSNRNENGFVSECSWYGIPFKSIKNVCSLFTHLLLCISSTYGSHGLGK